MIDFCISAFRLKETIRLHEVNQNYLLEASKEAKTKLSDLVPGMKELEGEKMIAPLQHT